MRTLKHHYNHADVVNRTARVGVVALAILLGGAALAMTGGDDATPPPEVLAAIETTAELNEVIPVTLAPTTTTMTPTTLADPSTPGTVPGATTTSTVSQRAIRAALPPSTTAPPATTTTPPRPTTTTSTTTTTLSPTTTTTLPPTTTTTTLPPTTTTTLPPTLGTVHLHDLDADVRGSRRNPSVRVEVRVRNDANDNQSGVLVLGRFTGAYEGSVAELTNRRGRVNVEVDVQPGRVTFTLLGLEHPDYTYAPGDNRRDTSITVRVGDDDDDDDDDDD